MAQWHGISRRKPSGGRKVQARGKRATEISTEKQFALVGEPKRKIYRKTGGNTMVRVMAANQVSINNPKTGKTTLGTIHSVVENASDPNYVRRNILVKGAVIDTDKGRVRIGDERRDARVGGHDRALDDRRRQVGAERRAQVVEQGRREARARLGRVQPAEVVAERQPRAVRRAREREQRERASQALRRHFNRLGASSA